MAVDLRQVTRIGGYDDRTGYALSNVGCAQLLPDGDLAICDRTTREIRIFDLEGKLLRSLGRRGDGPGEFQTLRGAIPIDGGRLLAFDLTLKRVTVFLPDGSVEYSRLLDTSSFNYPLPSIVGAFSDGSVVLQVPVNPMELRSERPGLRRDPIRYALLSPEGDFVRDLVVELGPEQMFENNNGSWGSEDLLFPRQVVARVGSNLLYVGSTDSLSFRRFSSSGDEYAVLRAHRPPRFLRDREIEAERERRIEEARQRAEAPSRGASRFPGFSQDLARWEMRNLEDRPANRSLPAYSDLLVGAGGRLWVKDYTAADSERATWVATDETLAPIARLELLAGEALMAVDDEIVVTLVKDELGVETIVVYRMNEIGR